MGEEETVAVVAVGWEGEGLGAEGMAAEVVAVGWEGEDLGEEGMVAVVAGFEGEGEEEGWGEAEKGLGGITSCFSTTSSSHSLGRLCLY